MTWPKEYGGSERSYLDRYIVTEEFRAVTAPTWAHFVADRQSGPVILKFGSETIKKDILPRIARGEVAFAIGMSEPNSGSDLFAAASKAEKVDGGFRLNGVKVWTSNAHQADYMIGLFRTSPPTKENRRHGLTQFVIDMSWEGITASPIIQMTGKHDFNEVVFENVFVPDDYLLGEVDGAWKQATSELAYERSGPERFLETFYVLVGLLNAIGDGPVDVRTSEGIGRLVAQLHTLRRMSVSVAGMLEAGKEPVLEASIVKDAGTIWEQELPARVRSLAAFIERDRATTRTSTTSSTSPCCRRRNSPSRAARQKCCAASSPAASACAEASHRRSRNSTDPQGLILCQTSRNSCRRKRRRRRRLAGHHAHPRHPVRRDLPAGLQRAHLSGDANPQGDRRAHLLSDRRRPARGGRPRRPARARRRRRRRDRALRQGRHQGGIDRRIRLRRADRRRGRGDAARPRRRHREI